MKKLLSGLIVVLMVSLLGHSFNAEAASYEKIIYDKAVNLKGVVNQSKRNDGINSKMYKTSSSVKYLGSAKKYDKKTLIITREGKTARAKWYYCKLGNTTIGWIDSRAFTNIGKPTIADTVPALWNSKKAIITTKPKALPQQPTFSKKIVLEIGMKFVILPVISANGDLIQSSLKKVLELQLAFTEQALLLDKRGTLVRN